MAVHRLKFYTHGHFHLDFTAFELWVETGIDMLSVLRLFFPRLFCSISIHQLVQASGISVFILTERFRLQHSTRNKKLVMSEGRLAAFVRSKIKTDLDPALE